MRHRQFAKIPGPGESLGVVPGGAWVALEKIHGAQMMIAVAGESVRFGKRKAWLADDDPFFGWQLIRATLAETARTAARAVGAGLVVFYGELFGGCYPHPDVAPVPGIQPVQTGIWYAPDLRWAVFDAVVARDESDAGELLAFHELEDLSESTGLMIAPLLRRGPRSHCDGAPTRYPTHVPARLRLPELEGNVAEGIVVRPDARARPGARPTYKRKIAEFDEQRFSESEAWDPNQRLDRPAMLSWAARLTNAPRIASAASKVGRHDHAALLDEIELDVLVDLTAAFPATFDTLSPADEQAVREAIRTAALPLLQEPG